ncbi:helix-turn-helix domain-containing protein [Methylobacterium oryzihabitans]|uniref:Transcriptional regulator n=1 Tax=Methylobacterium oryzihabitans TaxID=2499852 RepID=A0A437NVI4_9HYPH|nr:transcriptional regulator [Methylobacterium oryzihabitans]RVU13881.1 transcriptional regulator [Methylobacterium oryzihabitans]
MNPLVKQAAEHWRHVAPLLAMPATDAEYRRLVEQMDEVLALAGEDENHPLALLASRMGDLIEAYDEAHRPMPPVAGAEALRFIMQERGLGQGEVPEVGPQSVVSEILSGKRRINLRQARALSARFGFPAGVFLGL